MKIGYARVSRDDQNLDLQKDALLAAGCEKIFSDQMSGAKADRPGLNRTLDNLRGGDVLVIWRLDRLGRSVKNLIEIMAVLESRQIELSSLQESINTATSGGKLIFHVFAAVAEFERNLLKERTQAGTAAARARGKTGGRPFALSEEKRKLAVKAYLDKELTVKQVCEIFGISKKTLYSYVDADGGI